MVVELPGFILAFADVALQTDHDWGSVSDITDVLVDNPEIWLGAAAGGAFGAALVIASFASLAVFIAEETVYGALAVALVVTAVLYLILRAKLPS